MRTFRKIFLLFIFIFLCLLYSCSTSDLFYYPDKEITRYPDTARCRYEEVNFSAPDGSNLNGWFIKPKSDTAKIIATVLFLHGNGGNIGYQSAPLEVLAQNGFQGLVFDYEGYGRSEGKPSQEKVLADALQAADYLTGRKDVENTKLILFGQSLGGHLACVAACRMKDHFSGKNPVQAFVIEGGFTSHKDIAAYRGRKDLFIPGFLARWFVPSRYNAIDHIDSISVPKLIIHSSEDEVCPFYMGKELFEKAKGPKQFWEVKGKHIAACRLYSDEFAAKFRELVSQK